MESITSYIATKRRVIEYIRKRQDLRTVTVQDLALWLKWPQQKILDLVEDTDELCLNTGIGIKGMGIHKFDQVGDYTVETYE